ncbi:DUF4918 family protein [Hymenobacter sp. BT175]|uniref:uracil-DNA glycosylase family protein n=1 Tax=Hymenobacter translucens TaxID=2886507 RepID=UPI001D0F35C3|nr:uracil-DNA glycosylase family protein [Hymenobacter translucens]MCC2546279.1 DUF4918 family protein [Hymenobacter translucens]
MPGFADQFLHLLTTFPAPPPLPGGVEAYNPYQLPAARELLPRFAHRFYSDGPPRVALLGINPGRFGAGTTGIAFTDPDALARHCGIANDVPRRAELSSQFVYRVIEAFGGAEAFYRQFYLSSVYPLVLLRQGLNYNYYDAPALTRALLPELRTSLRRQVEELGLARHAAVCLGRRNGQFLTRLNDELGLFQQLHILDHPRYVMQYKRREVPAYVEQYLRVLEGCMTK